MQKANSKTKTSTQRGKDAKQTKVFTVTNRDLCWEMMVEITLPDAEAPIKEMVEFWFCWERRLARNQGDYVKTFLQQLGRECLYAVISDQVGLTSLIEWFQHREGWYAMDGSKGIKITDVFSLDFVHCDFDVEENEEGKE